MNSKERGFWERYLRSVQKYGLRGIESCYDKPSQAKKEAYRCIVSANPGARYMTVVSAGLQTFSVGWLFKTIAGWCFKYETSCNSYCAALSEDDMAEAQARGICPWKK